ncbi:MAG: outer membrane beta-barrel protein [Candidatus Fibromonas sp.]|jgi:hypothetical protein|nr:outer membrane beta-barrel protein [Candidatus Fibromonas sp.]
MNIKHAFALFLACSLMSAYAQDAPDIPEKEKLKKFAVYTYGASDAGINKSFGNKLLAAIVQSGQYAEIENPELLYKGLAKNNEDNISRITQTAKQHGADFICAVSMTEVFDSYSISARIIKIADSQVVKTALLDHSLKSLDDLTKASNELANKLLQSSPPAATSPDAPIKLDLSAFSHQESAPATAPSPQKECKNTFNINEITFKIQDRFPKQLKDCSVDLAKSMAPVPGFLKKSAESEQKKPPKEFMTQCTIDGIKKELPANLANVDKFVGKIENFVQNILNSASSANGELDINKLSKAVDEMNIGELLDGIKKLALDDACMVDEPYKSPIMFTEKDEESNSDEKKVGRKIVSPGFRTGFNFSNIAADYSPFYNSIGFQLGFVLDIAIKDALHLQPGIMYIQKVHIHKGRKYDYDDSNVITLHYIEFPMQISLKFSVFRFNIGPYIGLCTGNVNNDSGISTGLGFDIGKFYIDVFYDYGLTNAFSYDSIKFYNRTFGSNFGVNL